jgi:hypothetical protein
MKLLDKNFEDYGPTPRICIDYIYRGTRLSNYQECFERAIEALDVKMLRRLASGGTEDLDAASHTLFLVKRVNEADLVKAILETIMSGVKVRLKIQIQILQQAERIRLYEQLASVNPARRLAASGLVFETSIHIMLQKGTTLQLVPMLHQPPDSGTVSYWVSAHDDHQAPSTIDIRPNNVVEYEGSSLDKICKDTFYVPKATNQVAFDSFIYCEEFFYIFQISIAANHSIKSGIVDFFSPRLVGDLPPKDHLRFIFIIPPGNKISCPQPYSVVNPP